MGRSRRRWREAAKEQVVEDGNRIAQIECSIVVAVAGILAIESGGAEKESSQDMDPIAEVKDPVMVAVAASEDLMRGPQPSGLAYNIIIAVMIMS